MNFENMLRTSHLIYNDSVSKIKHEILTFPIYMIAGILGFKQRDHLEQRSVNEDKQKNNIELRQKVQLEVYEYDKKSIDYSTCPWHDIDHDAYYSNGCRY